MPMRILHPLLLFLGLLGFLPVGGQEAVRAWDSAQLTGTIVDADGKPLAGAKVTVNRMMGAVIDEKQLKLGFTATTDSGGAFVLPLQFEKGKTLRLMEIWADKPGYVRGVATNQPALTAGSKSSIQLSLTKGEILAGRFQASSPQAAKAEEDGRLWFGLEGPALASWPANARTFFTDDKGSFEITVPKGEYSVSLVRLRKSWAGIQSGQKDLVFTIQGMNWTENELGPVFDDFWTRLNNQYSYFFLKPGVDWAALKQTFRPKAVNARDPRQLASVLQEMLAPLQDMHVWIQVGGETLPTHRSRGALNVNGKVVFEELVDITRCGRFAVVGKTKNEGFGYFLMTRQTEATPALVAEAVQAIRQLSAVPGFIVDLRGANGGSEPLAMEIAALFCSQEVVYAKSKRRNGTSHDSFGPINNRILRPAEKPFTRPVICLVGPGTVSSGEGFAKMMKALPHVTLMGLRTRGASGNPQPHELGQTGVTVYFSTWVDLMPDETTFEGKGIPPEIEVNAPESEYKAADPTLEKALEVLRKKIKPAAE